MYPRFLQLLSYSNSSVFQPFSSRFLWLIVASVLSLLFLEGSFSEEAIRILSHEFDPDNIAVGDPVELRLRIEADEHLHIYLDPMDGSGHEHLEIDKPQIKRIKSEVTRTGRARYEVTYLLRAFATGAHTLPPITIKYADPDGDHGSIQTPTYQFEVRTVKPPGSTEIKGIKAPWSVSSNWFLYILVIVFVVVGVLVFFYFRNRAKPTGSQPEVVPQRQPHEIAYEQLNRIEGMNLVAQGEMKVYHTEISQVIRQYIAARYHIPALELTTQELLDRLQPEDMPKERVRHFFTNCDLVKFARYSPTKPEAHERMEEARRIVDETK